MPRLLRDWARNDATGTLKVTAPQPSEDVCTVLVQDGTVVFASRRSRRDPTGELFLELFEVPGYDGENDDEVDLVRSEVTSVITDLFNWTTTDYSFRPHIHLTRWPAMNLQLSDLMRCGMLAVTDTQRVRSWLGNTGRRFVRSDDPYGMFLLPLDELEASVLEKLDRPRTLADLVEASGVTEELVVRLLGALVFAGAVEETTAAFEETETDERIDVEVDETPGTVVEVPEGAADTSWWPESEPQLELEPEPEPEPELEPEPVFDPQETARFWYETEEKARAVRDERDFYALLEVDRRANTDAIIARYRVLATKYHPDRNSRFAPRDEDGRTELDVIFDALTTAFAVLTKPAFREVYDHELVRREREQAIPVTTPLVRPSSAPLPAPTAFVTQPLPSEPTTVGLPPTLPGVAEAFEIPLEPAPPVEAVAPPSPARASGSLTAVDWFRRGEEFEAAGDHSRASEAYERCAEIGPDRAKVFLALGRSLARVGDSADRAEDMLLKAVNLSPFSLPCYLALGDLYARLGRHEEARTQFKRALTIRTDDPEATAALAALERPGPSLIRRFFGS